MTFNEIGPDARFLEILTQQIEGTPKWEIYLHEENKGLIPLSQSGHGLQTVILVLVHTILIPDRDNVDLAKFMFGFEELENNLHPALFRRLLMYLRNLAVESGATVFLTSHSHVAIDMFSRDEEAQIIHVTHDGNEAKCRTVTTYVENCGILDDLDVRASDILQANSVIWVEGPSDRTYINRWIEIQSNGNLKEGLHYQCAFYGGKLLSHLSATDPESDDDGIKLFRLNRRACVVMDSDKKSKQSRVNATKRRIEKEINELGGMSWITKGREIENYLPADAVAKSLGVAKLNQVGQYDDFFGPKVLEKMKTKKPAFAEQVVRRITEANWDVLGLSQVVGQLCEAISGWNQMRD